MNYISLWYTCVCDGGDSDSSAAQSDTEQVEERFKPQTRLSQNWVCQANTFDCLYEYIEFSNKDYRKVIVCSLNSVM